MIARGNSIGSQTVQAFTVFKTFQWNYMLKLIDLGFNKRQIKAALWMLLTPMVFGGAAATLPVALLKVVARAWGSDDDDLEESYLKWLDENTHAYVSNFFRFGIFGTLDHGVSLKGSLEINFSAPTNFYEVFGAPGAIIQDFSRARDLVKEDRIWEAGEKVAPTSIGNASRAIREGWYGGVRQGSSGEPVMYKGQPLQPNLFETAMRFISFNPARIAKVQEQRFYGFGKSKALYADMKGNLDSPLKREFMKPPGERDQAKLDKIVQGAVEHGEKVAALNKWAVAQGLDDDVEAYPMNALDAREVITDRLGAFWDKPEAQRSKAEYLAILADVDVFNALARRGKLTDKKGKPIAIDYNSIKSQVSKGFTPDEEKKYNIDYGDFAVKYAPVMGEFMVLDKEIKAKYPDRKSKEREEWAEFQQQIYMREDIIENYKRYNAPTADVWFGKVWIHIPVSDFGDPWKSAAGAEKEAEKYRELGYDVKVVQTGHKSYGVKSRNWAETKVPDNQVEGKIMENFAEIENTMKRASEWAEKNKGK
jgi:hypothetical protein